MLHAVSVGKIFRGSSVKCRFTNSLKKYRTLHYNYKYHDLPMRSSLAYRGDSDVSEIKHQSVPKLTKLSNGLQIISSELGGYNATIGAYVKVGPRWENKKTTGFSKLIEMLLFQNSNANLRMQTMRRLGELGAMVQNETRREFTEFSAVMHRRKATEVLPILLSELVHTTFSNSEVQHCLRTFKNNVLPVIDSPETIITETLHSVAWQNNTLGLPLVPLYKDSLDLKELEQFKQTFYRPDLIVVGGVNVNHHELCSIAEEIMGGAFMQNRDSESSKDEIAKYVGGQQHIKSITEPFLHLAVGYNVDITTTWREQIALALLQMIMKGGETFSTGGPGKGMYTRLYMEVLTKNWVESCLCFNFQYSDSGLFGLYLVASSTHAQTMIETLKYQFDRLSEVSLEELRRAQNALKSNLCITNEHPSTKLCDQATQLLLKKKVLCPSTICTEIDEISLIEVQNVANRILSTRPTIVSYSSHSQFPQILEYFSYGL